MTHRFPKGPEGDPAHGVSPASVDWPQPASLALTRGRRAGSCVHRRQGALSRGAGRGQQKLLQKTPSDSEQHTHSRTHKPRPADSTTHTSPHSLALGANWGVGPGKRRDAGAGFSQHLSLSLKSGGSLPTPSGQQGSLSAATERPRGTREASQRTHIPAAHASPPLPLTAGTPLPLCSACRPL